MAIDCLIIGFNDSDFPATVDLVRAMGDDAGAYRDMNLAFITHEGRPYRSMDLLNRFRQEDDPEAPELSNVDFLWPVVTYLGTYLERRGFSFEYANLFHLEKERVRKILETEEVLTVAVTTTLYVSPHPILEVVEFIRRYNDRAKIVIGGPYISGQARMNDREAVEEAFDYLGGDVYVISQEGEGALAEIVEATKNGGGLAKIDNIAFKDGGKFTFTETSIERNALDENMVDYSLFPKDRYNRFLSLRTAKSCPFACSFCGFPQRAGKYTYLTTELVEKELDAIAELGVVDTLTFIDDTFNVPKKRFKEVLEMMIEKDYGFKWNSFYRSDHGTPEVIELMARAGCEGVFLGIESGSDTMLGHMNKTARRKHYLEAIPLLKEAGIWTHASLIIGFPGETYYTVAETIDLIETAKPHTYRAQLWYADPVTPIWQKREEYGIEGSAFTWRHNTMDSAMACDLVDRMFLNVENSVWLPQHGFEQWSLFYLERLGMSREQILTFLKVWSTAVKEKLVDPRRSEPRATTMAALRQASRFGAAAADGDDFGEVDLAPVELYSPAAYNRAERALTELFRGASPGGQLEVLGERPELRMDGDGGAPGLVERRIDGLGDGQLLAAFALLWGRLNGREETILLAAEDRPIPLRLALPWSEPFAAAADAAGEALAAGREHALYALSIVTNPHRMKQHGATCPSFDIGFVTGEPGGTLDARRLLSSHLASERELGLVLQAVRCGDGLTLRWLYDADSLTTARVEELAAVFERVLDTVRREPGIALDEIPFDDDVTTAGTTVDAFAEDTFNF